jgi:hypothetical protein
MKRVRGIAQLNRTLWAVSLIVIAAGICAKRNRDHSSWRTGVSGKHYVHGRRNLIGSLGHGNVLRIAPGKATAEEWIKPGTGGLNGVLGVYADEKGKLLWVCSNNLENKGEATSVKTFDLKTGAPKGTYPLPGEGPL